MGRVNSGTDKAKCLGPTTVKNEGEGLQTQIQRNVTLIKVLLLNYMKMLRAYENFNIQITFVKTLIAASTIDDGVEFFPGFAGDNLLKSDGRMVPAAVRGLAALASSDEVCLPPFLKNFKVLLILFYFQCFCLNFVFRSVDIN